MDTRRVICTKDNIILKKEKLSISYYIQSRVDLLLKEDTIDALAESGLEEVWVGAESGSQAILDAMDKDTKVEQIYEATKLLKDKNEILKPLREVRESLNLNRGQHIANADLLDLIRRVRCFGINLARLDIRQESSRHQKLISDVLNKKYKINFSSLSESKKINLLKLLIKQKK